MSTDQIYVARGALEDVGTDLQVSYGVLLHEFCVVAEWRIHTDPLRVFRWKPGQTGSGIWHSAQTHLPVTALGARPRPKAVSHGVLRVPLKSIFKWSDGSSRKPQAALLQRQIKFDPEEVDMAKQSPCACVLEQLGHLSWSCSPPWLARNDNTFFLAADSCSAGQYRQTILKVRKQSYQP